MSEKPGAINHFPGNFRYALRCAHQIFCWHDDRIMRDQDSVALRAAVDTDAAASRIFHNAVCCEEFRHAKSVRHLQIVAHFAFPQTEARESYSTNERNSKSRNRRNRGTCGSAASSHNGIHAGLAA